LSPAWRLVVTFLALAGEALGQAEGQCARAPFNTQVVARDELWQSL